MIFGIGRLEVMIFVGGCWDDGMEYRLGIEEDFVEVIEEEFLI